MRLSSPAYRRTLVTLVAALSGFLLFAGAGTAVASWLATASASGSVSAATLSLTAGAGNGSSSGSLTTEYKFSTAAPSPGVVRTILLTNTGPAALNYAFTLPITGGATLAPSISVTIWKMVGSCTTTPGTGSTTGTVAAPPTSMPAGATSAAAGTSVTLCLMTKLTTTVAASQGQTLTAAPTFTGTVGTSGWKVSASDVSFTQTVYKVGDVTAAKCVTVDPIVLGLIPGYVTLSWSAPSSGSTGVTYKIVDTNTGSTILNSGTSPKSLFYGDLSTSPDTVTIYAMESTYSTTSRGVSFTLTRASNLFGLLLNAVYCPAA